MANGQGDEIRRAILNVLLQHIAAERHPSISMMDVVEQLLRPDEVPVYAAILLDKVETERFPSLPMVRRLLALAS